MENSLSNLLICDQKAGEWQIWDFDLVLTSSPTFSNHNSLSSLLKGHWTEKQGAWALARTEGHELM